MSTTINESPLKPTVIQGIDQTPSVELITTNDFSNFFNSGCSIKIKTPLAKTNSQATFAICTNGFVPNPILSPGSIGMMLANFFPVQAFSNALDYTEIFWEPTGQPALFQYFSFRFNKGEANINIRLSSNTTQSGNFEITQFSNCQRYFYNRDEKYDGLKFINVGSTTKLTLGDGFALMDLSLNRSLAIKPSNRFCMGGEDHFYKWESVFLLKKRQFEDELDEYNAVTSQFLENWIVFSPLSSFPSESGNSVTLSIFFDWKEKLFWTPGIPIPPTDFSSINSGRICNFTKTFRVGNPPIPIEIKAIKSYEDLYWVAYSDSDKDSEKTKSSICDWIAPGSSVRMTP